MIDEELRLYNIGDFNVGTGDDDLAYLMREWGQKVALRWGNFQLSRLALFLARLLSEYTLGHHIMDFAFLKTSNRA